MLDKDFIEQVEWEAKFWDRVKKANGCKVYSEGETIDLPFSGRAVKVKDLAYEMYFSSIPNGYEVIRTCDRGGCIRRDHLALISPMGGIKELWRDDYRLREAYRRFWIKVQKPTVAGSDRCWLWGGKVQRSGYAFFAPGKDAPIKSNTIQRIAYEMKIGDIPEGYDVRWKCSNKICVNPAHLFIEPHGRDVNYNDIVRIKDTILGLVDMNDNNCWLWKGPIGTEAFFQFNINGRKRISAIEAINFLINGNKTTEDRQARGTKTIQKCGNLLCCNPAHSVIFIPEDDRKKDFLRRLTIREDDHWYVLNSVRKDRYIGTRQRSALYNRAYEYLIGPLTEGLSVIPKCRVLGCVNPDHLISLPINQAHEIFSYLLFQSLVRKTDNCWIWTGSVTKDGYGRFDCQLLTGKRKCYSAHKFSYLLNNGSVPDGLIVRHKCNNSICVRPDHLILGTHMDNANDRVVSSRTVVKSKIDGVTCSLWSVIRVRRMYRNFIKSISRILKIDYHTAKHILELNQRELIQTYH